MSLAEGRGHLCIQCPQKANYHRQIYVQGTFLLFISTTCRNGFWDQEIPSFSFLIIVFCCGGNNISGLEILVMTWAKETVLSSLELSQGTYIQHQSVVLISNPLFLWELSFKQANPYAAKYSVLWWSVWRKASGCGHAKCFYCHIHLR